MERLRRGGGRYGELRGGSGGGGRWDPVGDCEVGGGPGERRAARAAVLRPWEWPAYLRLAWALREATRALHQATPLVIAAGEATTRSAPGVSAAASAR